MARPVIHTANDNGIRRVSVNGTVVGEIRPSKMYTETGVSLAAYVVEMFGTEEVKVFRVHGDRRVHRATAITEAKAYAAEQAAALDNA